LPDCSAALQGLWIQAEELRHLEPQQAPHRRVGLGQALVGHGEGHGEGRFRLAQNGQNGGFMVVLCGIYVVTWWFDEVFPHGF